MIARLWVSMAAGWGSLRERLERGFSDGTATLAKLLPHVSRAHGLGAVSALVIVVAFAVAALESRPTAPRGLAPAEQRVVRLGCSACRRISRITAADLQRRSIEQNKYLCPMCRKFAATIYRDNQIVTMHP